MPNFTNKTVLVTGAASGIGLETVRAFARLGARIVACDVNDDGLRDLRDELGAKAILLKRVDVANRLEMRAFADDVHALVPTVDILINNAGVGLGGNFLQTTLDDWDWVTRINLNGVVHGCHFFLPKMTERRAGHVVNISSTFGIVASPQATAYCTTKFAVFGLSEALREEMREYNIGVSTICPGMIDTNIIATSRLRVPNEEKARAVAAKAFRDRKFSPSKVADAIVSAVEHNRDVVPVAPEAWASYYMKRIAPGITPALGRIVDKISKRQIAHKKG